MSLPRNARAQKLTCDVILQWLKTDMGSQNADLEIDVGAADVIRILLASDSKTNGKFLNIHIPGWENAEGPNKYNGEELPW